MVTVSITSTCCHLSLSLLSIDYTRVLYYFRLSHPRSLILTVA